MDTTIDDIEFEEADGEETLEVNPNMREIISEAKDDDVEKLHKAKTKGRLDIQPDFQRHYVWDPQKATSLIESALLLIPIPVVYLAEEEKGCRSVIDGQQRLTSFFSFIEGKFPDGSEFRLRKMQVYSELSGKRFDQLDEEYQERIQGCPIRTITFKRNSDEQLKFNVFERLNTGAMALNDQELRNCIYRGSYNDLLKELASNTDFQQIVGTEGIQKRMIDVELVLRFTSFLNTPYYDYKPPIKTFLNREMQERRDLSPEKADEITEAFKNSVSIIKSLFGAKAFRRYLPGTGENPQGDWEPKKFNVSLYDILMFGFAKRDKNLIFRHAEEIREAYIDLLTTDDEFMRAVARATSDRQMVNVRFEKWRKRLDSILVADKVQERCFTAEFKKVLFDKNPICEICHQRIMSIDDAAVDHIEQYWLGGLTIPENARLTHRYCNCARKRNDIAATTAKAETNDAEQEEQESSESGRSTPSTISITFSDGTVICEHKGCDTLVKFIQKIGIERVLELNWTHDKQPYIIRDTAVFEWPAQGRDLGCGFQVNAHSSTDAKCKQIEKLAKQLGLSITVEKVAKKG